MKYLVQLLWLILTGLSINLSTQASVLEPIVSQAVVLQAAQQIWQELDKTRLTNLKVEYPESQELFLKFAAMRELIDTSESIASPEQFRSTIEGIMSIQKYVCSLLSAKFGDAQESDLLEEAYVHWCNALKKGIDDRSKLVIKQEAMRISQPRQEAPKIKLKAITKSPRAIIIENADKKYSKTDSSGAPLAPQENKLIKFMQTPQEYLASYTHASSTKIRNINRIAPYAQLIIDVRGDDNCEYRAILASLFFNSLQFKEPRIYPYIKDLIRRQYLTLFLKYDQDFNGTQEQESIGKNIQEYLLEIIDRIEVICLKNETNYESLEVILNQEYAFDYYMIMFMRYLIVDYLNQLQKVTHKTERENNILSSLEILEAVFSWDHHDHKMNYLDSIAGWQTQGCEFEAELLKTIFNVNLSIFKEDADLNQNYQSDSPIGLVTLWYVTGHYRCFIPKQESFDTLMKGRSIETQGEPESKESDRASLHQANE